MRRLDLVLAPVKSELALDLLCISDVAASAVGAISSGGGTLLVRCFFFGC